MWNASKIKWRCGNMGDSKSGKNASISFSVIMLMRKRSVDWKTWENLPRVRMKFYVKSWGRCIQRCERDAWNCTIFRGNVLSICYVFTSFTGHLNMQSVEAFATEMTITTNQFVVRVYWLVIVSKEYVYRFIFVLFCCCCCCSLSTPNVWSSNGLC